MIIPPAFSILSVEQNLTTQQIVVKLRVGGDSKHLPLLYMSKPVWSEAYPEQVDASTNQCQPKFDGTVRVDKTCCQQNFVDQYQTASDVENHFRNNTGVYDNGQSVVPSPSNSAQVFDKLYFPTPLITSQLLQDSTPAVTYESHFVDTTSNYGIELRFTMDYLETRTRIVEQANLVGTFE